MKPTLKAVTLAVDDLDRALRFYRDGLGLPTAGIIGEEFEHGSVVFLNFRDEFILALYPAEFLAKDSGAATTRDRRGAMSLGHVAPTKDEVVAIVAAAEAAGAIVTDRPKERFWGGFSGYFQDPDGHLWEVLWHPEWSERERVG